MAYGVTETGFIIKPLDVIEEEIDASLKAALGQHINTLPASVLGQLKAIFADREFELWELAQGNYAAAYLLSASGQSLDNLGALVGALRMQATVSTVTLTLTLDPTTTISAGAQAKVPGTEIIFETIEDVTSVGSGDYDVLAQAITTGPLVAGVGTITEIVTPQSGWTAVDNAAIAVTGRDIETDAAFRVRISELQNAIGNATAAAIRADLLTVDGVQEITVLVNDTDAEVDTIPPHSIECIVRGGDDADIAARILATKAAGVGTWGSDSEIVTDDQGFDHTIYFTRPTALDLVVEVDITTDDDYAGASATAAIKTALSNEIATYLTGQDVYSTQLYNLVFAVGGVVDITDFLLGVPTASGTSYTVGQRAYVTLDTADITINVT